MRDIKLAEFCENIEEISKRVLKHGPYRVFKGSKAIFEIHPAAAQADIKPESIAKRLEKYIIKEKSGLENISNSIDDIIYG